MANRLWIYKESVTKRSVPWSALIFNAAVLVLSGTLTLEDVGISNFLVEKVTPLVSGLNQGVFILIIAALCIIATNFSSNTVCATVFFTISAPIALAMGNVNMVALASVIGAAASYAFATPPSTMPMAVVAGTGWVDVKQMLQIRRSGSYCQHSDPVLHRIPDRCRNSVTRKRPVKTSFASQAFFSIKLLYRIYQEPLLPRTLLAPDHLHENRVAVFYHLHDAQKGLAGYLADTAVIRS